MKFDKSQDSSWNALVVYVNSRCILAGSKPQKKIFCFTFCLFKEVTNAQLFLRSMEIRMNRQRLELVYIRKRNNYELTHIKKKLQLRKLELIERASSASISMMPNKKIPQICNEAQLYARFHKENWQKSKQTIIY